MHRHALLGLALAACNPPRELPHREEVVHAQEPGRAGTALWPDVPDATPVASVPAAAYVEKHYPDLPLPTTLGFSAADVDKVAVVVGFDNGFGYSTTDAKEIERKDGKLLGVSGADLSPALDVMLAATLPVVRSENPFSRCAAEHTDDMRRISIRLVVHGKDRLRVASYSNCSQMVPWDVWLDGIAYLQLDGRLMQPANDFAHLAVGNAFRSLTSDGPPLVELQGPRGAGGAAPSGELRRPLMEALARSPGWRALVRHSSPPHIRLFCRPDESPDCHRALVSAQIKRDGKAIKVTGTIDRQGTFAPTTKWTP